MAYFIQGLWNPPIARIDSLGLGDSICSPCLYTYEEGYVLGSVGVRSAAFIDDQWAFKASRKNCRSDCPLALQAVVGVDWQLR